MLKPCSSTQRRAAARPLRAPRRLDVQQPPDLARVAAGRDAPPSSIVALRGARTRRRPGRPATAASRRPCARSAAASAACRRRARCRCRAPAPARAWRRTRWCSPSTRTPRRVETSQIARMTSIASLSASTAWPGVSRAPPIASIASQNAPAPSPSSTPAAGQQVQARRGARQHGRLAQRQVEHVRRDAQRLGRRGDPGQQRPGVQEGRLVRVVLERGEVQPGALGQPRERDDVLRALVCGVMKVPKVRSWP